MLKRIVFVSLIMLLIDKYNKKSISKQKRMHAFGIGPNTCMKPPPFVNLFLSKSGAK